LSGEAADWQVYLLRSADGRASYVGIAHDPHMRLLQHNGERPGGARRTRAGRPWTLGAISCTFVDRSSASRAERVVKGARGFAARRDAIKSLESVVSSDEDGADLSTT